MPGRISVVGHDPQFEYRQDGNVVWATYRGGGVARGTLVATVGAGGKLDMRYQHVTTDGAIKTGRCQSTPEVLPDGRLRLAEAWTWAEGGTGRGTSTIEEVRGAMPTSPESIHVRASTAGDAGRPTGGPERDQPGCPLLGDLGTIHTPRSSGGAMSRHVVIELPASIAGIQA